LGYYSFCYEKSEHIDHSYRVQIMTAIGLEIEHWSKTGTGNIRPELLWGRLRGYGGNVVKG
jgi:hypothetical protein